MSATSSDAGWERLVARKPVYNGTIELWGGPLDGEKRLVENVELPIVVASYSRPTDGTARVLTETVYRPRPADLARLSMMGVVRFDIVPPELDRAAA